MLHFISFHLLCAKRFGENDIGINFDLKLHSSNALRMSTIKRDEEEEEEKRS